MCIATLFSGIDDNDVSLTSRFTWGSTGTVADRDRAGGGFWEADLSSVSTRSRVRRGFRICCLCSDASCFKVAQDDADFVNGGRFGEVFLGPPSFLQIKLVNSGRRAP